MLTKPRVSLLMGQDVAGMCNCSLNSLSLPFRLQIPPSPFLLLFFNREHTFPVDKVCAQLLRCKLKHVRERML